MSQDCVPSPRAHTNTRILVFRHQVTPIAVTDVLGVPRGAAAAAAAAGADLAALNAVQGFLNSVVTAAGYGPNPAHAEKELKHSVSQVGARDGAGGYLQQWWCARCGCLCLHLASPVRDWRAAPHLNVHRRPLSARAATAAR